MGETDLGWRRAGLGKRIAVVIGLLGLCAVLTRPAGASDALQGRRLAVQWCSGCHVLPGFPARSVLQGPPSFREIAEDDMTAQQIKVFLAHPHRPMPPLALSRAEIDALVAYIETLR